MTTPAANVVTKLSLPSKVYQALVKSAEPFVPKKLLPLWNHPAGKTHSFFSLFNSNLAAVTKVIAFCIFHRRFLLVVNLKRHTSACNLENCKKKHFNYSQII